MHFASGGVNNLEGAVGLHLTGTRAFKDYESYIMSNTGLLLIFSQPENTARSSKHCSIHPRKQPVTQP